MNEKIPIIHKPPIVFTKDIEWAERMKGTRVRAGMIQPLPEDAVLLVLPDIIEQRVETKPQWTYGKREQKRLKLGGEKIPRHSPRCPLRKKPKNKKK